MENTFRGEDRDTPDVCKPSGLVQGRRRRNREECETVLKKNAAPLPARPVSLPLNAIEKL